MECRCRANASIAEQTNWQAERLPYNFCMTNIAENLDRVRAQIAQAAQKSNRRDIFVYFKHEESGIGPKLAKQMMELLR